MEKNPDRKGRTLRRPRGPAYALAATLALAAAVAGCAPPAGSPIPADPVPQPPPGPVVSSDLFVPAPGKPGELAFRTNDPARKGPRGHTYWYLGSGVQEPFVSRAAYLSKASGNAEAGYGLVICNRPLEAGGTRETMILVMINNQGKFIVGEAAGTDFQAIIPWKPSSALRKGANQRNHVRVALADGVFSLSFNGVLAATFKDALEPLHDAGADGFVAVVSPLDEFPGVPVEIAFEED